MKKNKITKIRQKLNQYLEYLELARNVSSYTIRNYKHYLEDFALWINQKYGDVALAKIDSEKIRQYRLHLRRYLNPQGLPLKRVTQSYYLIALRSFLKWLIRNDEPVIAPEKIELPKSESRSLKFLTRQQIEQLLAQPKISKLQGLRDKAILEVLFSTGLRVSELVKLNRDQINFESCEFGVIGKGQKPRVVFLSERAAYWLKKYLSQRKDHSPALFINHHFKSKEKILSKNELERLRLSVRSVQRLVDRYCRSAKLPIKISPHGLRHSFATDLLAAGADLRSVQEMLGHKNLVTTQIYTHVTNRQLKEVHRKFHSGNR